ncbi:MFS general substrate transporter [Hygrophoropsis aurantiaca]|uniref:MFS general substrate transporter n=1 Tax=Hygrophoropsis aurantiaca TaxID=72124 RepID=A0ACB8A2T9_9AGAM|nr:MFS general substrate transporter [Hygrophoropsis aurantiaca]
MIPDVSASPAYSTEKFELSIEFGVHRVKSLNIDDLDSPLSSPASDSEAQIEKDPKEPQLPPPDRGIRAWLYLAASFIVEAIVWGYPMAYGTFLNAYLLDPQYASQPQAAISLPIVGPLSSGMIYCSGNVLNPFIGRYPRSRRAFVWIGSLLCFVSLFSSSYIKNVVYLVVLQGFLYGLGGSLLYAPTVSYLTEWFVERRGMANGVMFAGTGIGGFLFPLFLPSLLDKFGPEKSLRMLAIGLAVVLLPFLPFVKERLPMSRDRAPQPKWSRSAINNPAFWFILVANTVHGLGFFVPYVWLPTFATALGANSTEASLTLALLNVCVSLSGVFCGILGDKINPWVLATCSASFATFAIFILWGLAANSLGGLIAFGVLFGLIGGGWTAMWASLIKPMAAEDPEVATTLFGYLFLSRGLGNILSTPISTALIIGSASLDESTSSAHARVGYAVANGKFRRMIIGAGIFLAGGVIAIGSGMIRERMKSQR